MLVRCLRNGVLKLAALTLACGALGAAPRFGPGGTPTEGMGAASQIGAAAVLSAPAAAVHEPRPARPASVYTRPHRMTEVGTAPRPATESAVQPSPAPAEFGQRSLWLLSTRRLTGAEFARGAAKFAPDVWRFAPERGWVGSSLDELLAAANAATVTSALIHGDDTSFEDAAHRGLDLYDRLRLDAPPAIAAQLIVWSWPSDQPGTRVRASARTNARRADLEAYFLARLLDRVSPGAGISVFGYCTGSRIAAGGLHVLGGGASAGLRLAPAAAPASRSIHATLLAAGVANDWMQPGMPHEFALSQVERLVMSVNAVDPVLRWYPYLWGRGGPSALGTTGPAEAWKLGAARAKVEVVDLEPALHRRHSWKYYADAPQVVALLRSELLRTQAAAGGAGARPALADHLSAAKAGTGGFAGGAVANPPPLLRSAAAAP